MARFITTQINVEAKTLTITVEGQGGFVIDSKLLSNGILTRATLHGLKQKICDAAALGASYSRREKYEAMATVVARLTGENASWNKPTQGNTSGLLLRALIRMYPRKTQTELTEFLSARSKKEQAALRRNPAIAGLIEEIKAETADDGGIDGNELLAELS